MKPAAVAICSALILTARAARSQETRKSVISLKATIRYRFPSSWPKSEDEKRVEHVTVTCDEGKCRVRVVSISQHACGDGMTYQGRGFVPFDEMVQVNDFGPERRVRRVSAQKSDPG